MRFIRDDDNHCVGDRGTDRDHDSAYPNGIHHSAHGQDALCDCPDSAHRHSVHSNARDRGTSSRDSDTHCAEHLAVQWEDGGDDGARSVRGAHYLEMSFDFPR